MKSILLAIFAVLFLGTGLALANETATGEGPSKEQAVVSAKRRAVEQGLGAYIKSETTVIDSQLVADKILSHSAGYVTGYKIIGETKTDDGFSVTIDAKVDYKLLSDDATALAILNRSMGHPRFLVAFSKKGEGTKVFRDMDFIDEIYNGIVESLTDKQFRVVDRPSAQKFAQQVAATHGIDVDLNEAAAFGLQYHAEYTLLYSVGGEIKEGAVNTSVKLRIKTQLIDNTRSQVVASKMVEQSANGRSLETALETAARDGGKKVVNPIVDVLEKNWMDAQQNGQLYTVVIEGVDDPEAIGKFTGMLEKFPLVNDAKEVESGGGKTTFEATYKGKRDQLDRDVIRAAKELGWTFKKVRSEGNRCTWEKQ